MRINFTPELRGEIGYVHIDSDTSDVRIEAYGPLKTDEVKSTHPFLEFDNVDTWAVWAGLAYRVDKDLDMGDSVILHGEGLVLPLICRRIEVSEPADEFVSMTWEYTFINTKARRWYESRNAAGDIVLLS